MENQIDRPMSWPLLPGALTADLLSPFAPLSYNALNCAYKLEFICDLQLYEVIRRKMVSPPSEMLIVFANTAHYIDRRRDVHEELERLAIVEREHDYTPLWMTLARIVISNHADADAAVSMFEEIYNWCDRPERCVNSHCSAT
jgi:hypothetical protein